MFALNGISILEAPHSAIRNSVQRLNVKVTSIQGEIAIPMISADTYRLSIQVPESWPIPSAPRTSVSAIDVTWSLNSEVMAAMRTPPRPTKGLISTGAAIFFNKLIYRPPARSAAAQSDACTQVVSYSTERLLRRSTFWSLWNHVPQCSSAAFLGLILLPMSAYSIEANGSILRRLIRLWYWFGASDTFV